MSVTQLGSETMNKTTGTEEKSKIQWILLDEGSSA